jgi:hypothetical protein
VDTHPLRNTGGGPRFNATGSYAPRPVQFLEIQWQFAGTILAAIPIIQFVLLIAVDWFSGRAVILEPSYLTTAHLLHPVLEKLGPTGKAMSVKEISETIDSVYKVAYGVHQDDNGTYWLDLIEDSDQTVTIGQRMPDGHYE